MVQLISRHIMKIFFKLLNILVCCKSCLMLVYYLFFKVKFQKKESLRTICYLVLFKSLSEKNGVT